MHMYLYICVYVLECACVRISTHLCTCMCFHARNTRVGIARTHVDQNRSVLSAVGVLCERGEHQAVVEYPYGALQEDVRDSLQSRARNMDMASVLDPACPNYYQASAE